MTGAAVGALLAAAVLAAWIAGAVVRRGRMAAELERAAYGRDARAELAARSLELESVPQILGFSGVAARAVFGCERTVAFEPGAQEGQWEARLADGDERLPEVPPPLRGLFAWFKHNDSIAARADLGEPRFGAMRSPFGQIMDRYDIDVLMPLVHRGEMLAAIGLKLGRAPTPADRALMKQLRLEVTQACANVRLHREASHVISLAREVDLAGAVQQALVPEATEGKTNGLQWAGHFQAAGEAGSDFWSAYPVAPGRVLVIIGDATGQGLAGSMVSAVVKSCCDAIVDARADRIDPGYLLGTLNRALWRPEHPIHMTSFAALFDLDRRKVRYANAGHCFPYHRRNAGRLGVLAGSGPVLGDELQSRYKVTEQDIAPGDAIVLFTDGLVDTQDPEGKPFGERKLQRVLQTTQASTASSLRDAVLREVDKFRSGRPATDDAAMVVVVAR